MSDVTSLLSHATAITAEAPREAAVVLYRRLQLDQPADEISSARLLATAHGVFEATIGGMPVNDAVLSPGWTSYEWRLQVSEADVTDLILDDVEIEVLLGNGWWRGDLGFTGAAANYGETLAFLGALEIEYHDGSTQLIPTDTSWTARASDTPQNNLYNGQRIDARLRGQLTPLRVLATQIDRSTLVEAVGPPVVRNEYLAPQRIWKSPSGKTLVDFGQNLVGWVRLYAAGEAGSEVVLRHAEVLEDDELGTRPLRGAQATDTFVLSGDEDVFEPTLTFHGFRYVEVTGFPGELQLGDLQAVVVHSRMRRTGSFECSDERVNRLVQNSVWGQRGNFLDVPTDCPQRDERLGWTGDLSVYAPTAMFQFDVADFLHKWLLDLAVETRAAGDDGVPNIVPDVLKYAHFPPEFAEMVRNWAGPTAIWGDAAVWVPEALWWATGDLDRLAQHYPAMVLHLESVLPRVSPTGLWDNGFQFGDWLDPDASPHEPWAAKADPSVVATACLFRSASFAAETARRIRRAEDAERWSQLAERTRAAFNEHYVSADGTVKSDCATVYALAIHFGLLDDGAKAAAGNRLAQLVRERDHVITTGFAGTPYVTWALCETGHVEDAYRLLLQTDCPSWLYSVTMGATTIWERYDSMLPDGSINPGEMTSFNHYALGAVAHWLYAGVAGIQPAQPGYSKLRLAPTPGPGLDWAKATLDTPYGLVESGWRRDGDAVVVDVLVPRGVEAEVTLPNGEVQTVTGGRHSW